MAENNEERQRHDDRLARAVNTFEEAMPLLLRYQVSMDGDYNTALVQPMIDPFVIKAPNYSPHYDTYAVLDREVAVVDLLEDNLKRRSIKLPVAVPRVIADSGDEARHRWAAFTSAACKVLSWQELRELSAHEHQQLGRVIGEFTLGISEAVDPETYDLLIRPYDQYSFDREAELKEALGKLEMLRELGYKNLAATISRLGEDYWNLRQEREAAKPIFAHNEVHAGNISFKQDENKQLGLAEIFDFANAQIINAARNFRYLAMVHPEAVQAAIQTWQELTREVVRERVVNFWCCVQFTLACVQNVAMEGSVTDFTTGNMQYLYPDIDWQLEFSAAKRLRSNLL